jgi:DNA-binding transcriptional LysR family regulator
MELRHLRYFVAVAEAENITRAAAGLHVAQPAVSRQIQDLEEELGVALLERRAKSVHLTEPWQDIPR